jgi:hypothetical protein
VSYLEKQKSLSISELAEKYGESIDNLSMDVLMESIYNGDLVIGQSYNKGGMQVLSTQEANDPDTGKRR